jgi:hypothetical protein
LRSTSTYPSPPRFSASTSRRTTGSSPHALAAASDRAASRLLAAESLHGHKYAIDAMLAATAHFEHGDVTVITSDTDDLRRLCHLRIAVEPI